MGIHLEPAPGSGLLRGCKQTTFQPSPLLLLLLLKWPLLPGEFINLPSSRLGLLPGCSAFQGSDCRGSLIKDRRCTCPPFYLCFFSFHTQVFSLTGESFRVLSTVTCVCRQGPVLPETSELLSCLISLLCSALAMFGAGGTGGVQCQNRKKVQPEAHIRAWGPEKRGSR